MSRVAALFVLSTGVVTSFACSKKSEPEATPEPAPSASIAEPLTSAANPHAIGSIDARLLRGVGRPGLLREGPQIDFDAPASFVSAPTTNSFRKATYKFAKVAGDAEDAELAVSQALGGVDANVDRWGKQFGDATPKTEKKTVHDLPVTMVEVKGTYAGGGGMMGVGRAKPEPKEKYMLLGAIVDQGEHQTFFKMVGPEKTVTAAKKDFEKLVSTVRARPDAGAPAAVGSDGAKPAPAATPSGH